MGADLDAARHFLAAEARVLERRVFARLFDDGPAEPVRDAIAAYRNADGGFGHALEPDGRTPHSQPPAVNHALHVLHEADAWDEDLVAGAVGWLEATAPGEGGVTFVAPSVHGWPHAPWWVPDEGLPPSLIFTGLATATLHHRGYDHPWLGRATEWMWSRVDKLEEPHAYAVRGVLAFLDAVPNRDRAQRAYAEHVADWVQARVERDPEAEGEVHGPLDFAPRPDSLARTGFDDATIGAHLDHLEHAQRDDGGWTFNWLAWSPAAEREWRGIVTIEALLTLRANGRL